MNSASSGSRSKVIVKVDVLEISYLNLLEELSVFLNL